MTRSLAELGNTARGSVRRILFDAPKAGCGRLGIQEGCALRCEGREADVLLLRTVEGVRIRCPVTIARFVEIELLAGAADRTLPSGAAEADDANGH